MGTMLQQRGLTGNSDGFNLTHPDVIEDIHRQYIAAGAEIISTNTFSSNPISQREYGLENRCYEMARTGAEIARRAIEAAQAEATATASDAGAENAGRSILVAGSVGPTACSLTMASDLADKSTSTCTFDDMVEAYSIQIEGLLDGGADLILFETCFDALNAKAGLYALGKIRPGFPAIVSVAVSDRSGRTLTGQQLEAFYNSVRHYPLMAFGLNCSLGAEAMIPMVADVTSFCDVPVVCYPNAGLPNELGGYDETPEQMASAMRRMAQEGGLNFAGGCCGTTPAHIAAIKKELSECTPRPAAIRDRRLKVSGLSPVTIDAANNFTNIGERTNVAGSRKFAKLIAAGDYETALRIAADQIEGGASIIDINMDDAMLDSKVEMEKFVKYIQNEPSVAKAALMIDSSHWDTLLAGLKNAQGKCIVNSISLKEGEEAFLLKAKEIHSLGAAMVVMAFDEEGQATTFDRKIEICSRAYRLLTEAGIDPEEIIFDVNVLSVGTGLAEHSRYGVDFIEAVRWIKQNLPGSSTSGGISNLSFAFRGNNAVREAMHSAFLYHAIGAGLDMAIVNPGMLQVYDSIEPALLKCVEDVILDSDPDATERLIAKASELLQSKEEGGAKKVEQIKGTAEERLVEAIVKGSGERLQEDVMEALGHAGEAVKVIEGPLMNGMEKVGELFGAGKMFLPQVVKSAKIMRNAVAILEPYMSIGAEAGESKPLAIVATVKGDVHDIGKNIMAIVLGCNGFHVKDLGVMVEKETILDQAKSLGADLIGVSGLITPSLHQMELICRDMAGRGMTTPLFIGGATTSALHTAVKLAPLYNHVFYGPDASSTAVLAKRCMMDRELFESEQHAAQAKLRELYRSRKEESCDEMNKPAFPLDSYLKEGCHTLSDIPACEIAIEEVEEFINWNLFLGVWGMKGTELTPQAQRTLDEGKAVLEEIKRTGSAYITLADRIFMATAEGDDILLDSDNRLPMLRQEKPTGGRKWCLSLADFVPSEGRKAPFGLFAISVRSRHTHEKGCQCESCANEYEGMMCHAVKIALAEAASAWLDNHLRQSISQSGISVVKPAAGYASCPDHTLKEEILRLLDGEKLGISLTESYAMVPEASICGFIIFHAEACYPDILKISKSQYDNYAKRRGMTESTAERFLSNLL